MLQAYRLLPRGFPKNWVNKVFFLLKISPKYVLVIFRSIFYTHGLMKILVIGSGGREHALVWKIAHSTHVSKIFCAPGNAGISEIATCLSIAADDLPSLLKFAQ